MKRHILNAAQAITSKWRNKPNLIAGRCFMVLNRKNIMGDVDLINGNVTAYLQTYNIHILQM